MTMLEQMARAAYNMRQEIRLEVGAGSRPMPWEELKPRQREQQLRCMIAVLDTLKMPNEPMLKAGGGQIFDEYATDRNRAARDVWQAMLLATTCEPKP